MRGVRPPRRRHPGASRGQTPVAGAVARDEPQRVARAVRDEETVARRPARVTDRGRGRQRPAHRTGGLDGRQLAPAPHHRELPVRRPRRARIGAQPPLRPVGRHDPRAVARGHQQPPAARHVHEGRPRMRLADPEHAAHEAPDVAARRLARRRRPRRPARPARSPRTRASAAAGAAAAAPRPLSLERRAHHAQRALARRRVLTLARRPLKLAARRLSALLLDPVAERVEAAPQARVDRPAREVERGGDLAGREIQDVAQHDHRALLGPEPVQGVHDVISEAEAEPAAARARLGDVLAHRFRLTSPRWARARDQSIARLTTIRCSHGRSGRRRSKRGSARRAARNASCVMSSAAAASPVTSRPRGRRAASDARRAPRPPRPSRAGRLARAPPPPPSAATSEPVCGPPCPPAPARPRHYSRSGSADRGLGRSRVERAHTGTTTPHRQ